MPYCGAYELIFQIHLFYCIDNKRCFYGVTILLQLFLSLSLHKPRHQHKNVVLVSLVGCPLCFMTKRI